jgi:hypothetical protein
MLDIIFISYDEPNANNNWRDLKARFPHAKRINGVKGIANAHIEAAKKANTTFFYVVDGDIEVFDTFNFDYKPTVYEANYVHVWHSYNPATGADYGYGGIKLFSKKFFKDVKTQLDFTTTLTKDIKVIPEIAGITRFNSDPFRAYRGAFRESVKLYRTQHNETLPKAIREEAKDRLQGWIDPLKNAEFREFVAAGARAGIAEAKRRTDLTDLLFINDHDLQNELFHKSYPAIDHDLDPTPKKDNPMRTELFFTSRIAGALYDPFVIEHLPITELRDAISDGQMLSKTWLIEELWRLTVKGNIKPEGEGKIRVAILGGWIGTLALLMNCWELPYSVTSIDLDERANRIAEKFNYDYDFVTKREDMYDVNYNEYDVIINTSSEHIPNIPSWRKKLPAGKIVIVQNNDYEEGEGHVSTVTSAAELKRLLNLSEVLYEGTRAFPQYKRFMLIGRT